ncbi:MAG: hypothetical protein ABSD47_19785 [Candidatus Methylomirabilota bacterium]|jgi:hypothetical protein
MVAREPKNEQRLCEAVIRVLAGRTGERIISAEPIDTVVRNRPAVEWIYKTPSARFAVEHTRIESFPNQIAEGKRFAQLLEPLETELAGKLPGAFFLTVDAGAARVPAAEHAAVRRALAEWILVNGGTLDPEEKTGARGNCNLTATPPGVPFEVTLHRDCDYESRLFIMQGLVGDWQRLRRERIGEALARKCPKLLAAHEEGCVSVLILESDDVSLANRTVVAEGTVAELAGRDDVPDIIVWVRTSTKPWKGSFIKDGPKVYPEIDSQTVFDLGY